MRTHGVAATYRGAGCRCPDCTAAHNERQQKEGRRRAERFAADQTLAPHGNASTYRNWGCRCADCSAAHSAACRAYEFRTGRRAAVST